MASTNTLEDFMFLHNLKKIEFTSLTLKDKKSFKILLSLSRGGDYVTIPLSSAQDPDSLKAYTLDVDTLYRVAYALKKEQNIVIGCRDVTDDDGVHLEYILHKNTDSDTLEYSEDAFEGKILKGDTIRPSSAKTSASSTAKKSESKKDADKEKSESEKDAEYLDDKVKKIVAEIEAILPNYGKFEKSKLALLSTEMEKIIKKNFD